MAKETVKKVSTLTSDLVTKVVTAFSEAFTLARNSGSAIADFCRTATKAGLPAVPAEEDVIAIADAIEKKLGWTGDRVKVYKSEARAVIRQHTLLPQAIEELRTATGSCDYHSAVKLARLIKEHGNVGDAVKDATEKKEAAKSDPSKKIGSALKSYRKAINDGKRKNKPELLAAVDVFAAAIGIKFE
jgi:hypothetical protein